MNQVIPAHALPFLNLKIFYSFISPTMLNMYVLQSSSFALPVPKNQSDYVADHSGNSHDHSGYGKPGLEG